MIVQGLRAWAYATMGRVLVCGDRDPAEPFGGEVEWCPAAAQDLRAVSRLYATVVFAEPLPHSPLAEEWLTLAKSFLAEEGSILAGFPMAEDGADCQGRFSALGARIVLSRAGLEATETNDGEDGVRCVKCRHRTPGLSPYGEDRRRRHQRALALNARGEELFAAGDTVAALTKFAEASEAWNEDAVIYNNLATALHALGNTDQALIQVREALYLDPCLISARHNYRIIAQELGQTREADHILSLFGHD